MNSKNQLNGACDCCKNELNLDKLCVRKIKAHKICVDDINIGDTLCAKISSPEICAELIMAKKADINSSCITDLNVMNECVQDLTATNISTSTLLANEVCFPGTVRTANLLNCGKYRATVVSSGNTTYTLGDLFGFDTIIDDPNGNVTISPTTYTVPVSGYYVFTFKVNISNFVSTTGPIFGSPIGNPEIYVNGLLVRESFTPFLTFLNQQNVILTSLISLKTGDQVTMRYKLQVLDQILGLINVTGTGDIVGDGTEGGNSLFKIHMLSVDCEDLPCAPSIPCQPCTPQQCQPCIIDDGNSGASGSCSCNS